jgi:UPF0755 protein
MRKIAIIFLIIGVLLLGMFGLYQYQVSPTDKSSNAKVEVVIKQGMSTSQIASLLKKKYLIRDEFFFKVYMKLNRRDSIKASTYYLSKNMSLDNIVSLLEKGASNTDISITFKEGKTIKDYAKVLSETTNISEDEFLTKMKDKTYLTSLIKSYWFLTDAILDSNIYYGLEGYLAPDTYNFKDKDVTVEEVIKTLLDQEEKNLSPYKDTLSKMNVHEVLTLASISELEGLKDTDRKLIVGVFQNRLSKGMNLGSDVTTYYAFNQAMDKDLTSEMFNTYNPYNTRSSAMAGKLPVGPICNPSKESILASINPTKSDYYYFVADKNGNVYYTKTSSEHSAKVKELKEKGDWIW